MLNLIEYTECLNKAFEARYKGKGFFVSTVKLEPSPFPLYKKMKVTIMHYPSKEEVFNFTFQDKVPTGQEPEFHKKCLQEIITTVTYKIEQIWYYGESNI